ncbi:hypothetical protein [Bifidobacterium indicum]|uniref:hypothetical protein n=1 Tax=Bifidobacterium indicum TaxID=1691 RepID=UPI0030DAF1D0
MRPASGPRGGGTATCHVVSHDRWIAQTMLQALPSDTTWNLVWHDGLAPTPDLDQGDALWIDPGLLIARNAWLESLGHPPLELMAPPADWLTLLDKDLLGRDVMVSRVGEIRLWREPPDSLGIDPWSQVAGGRVPEFRAARRSLDQLQGDLAPAPDDSLIQISRHVDGIDQEWRVVVLDGRAVASSGYCRHAGPEGRDIITVFDGATFDQSLRTSAERTAVIAADRGGIDAVCLDLAFLNPTAPGAIHGRMHPIVLEANPAWCCSPYDYGQDGMEGFLAAIARGRAPGLNGVAPSMQAPSASDGRMEPPGPDSRMAPYRPDSWMVSQFRNRYRSYWNHR